MVVASVVLMRSLASQLVVPLLVVLLAMTTPVGTGDAMHQNDTLHPVLPHMHLLNGQIVSDLQLANARLVADAQAAAPRGVSFGAGTGADAGGLGTALSPTLPMWALVRAISPESRLSVAETIAPTEFREEPQDPPPDPFA